MGFARARYTALMPSVRALRLEWNGPAPMTGLAALGLVSAEILLEPVAARLERARELPAAPGTRRFEFALPGTPDARGNLVGRPGELGTGFLWLTSYASPLAPTLRARFTTPPSASLAERDWNVLCLLRAAGVGTSEPLCVGAAGNGLVARRSFLLVRALADSFPLARWLASDGHGAERARGLAALGGMLANLVRARWLLPQLAGEHLWLTPSGSGACESEGPGLRKNRLPGVSLSEVRGARQVSSAAPILAALERALASVAGLTPEERAQVLARAADARG
jgi:hypothetical protein